MSCRLLSISSHSDVCLFSSPALDGYGYPKSSSTVMPIFSSLSSVSWVGKVFPLTQFEIVWSENPSADASSSWVRIPSRSPSRAKNSLTFSPSMTFEYSNF